MQRVAFTIAFNARHHLCHFDYANCLKDSLDHWAIVEGPALPNGSTDWCKPIPERFLNGFHSMDGTVQLLHTLARDDPRVLTVYRDDFWLSKDEMVNAALDVLRPRVKFPCYLWQIDADEQWTQEQMEDAEIMLEYAGAKTGQFLCDYSLGPGLFAEGDWGEGRKLPYNRLWLWNGERFKTHEPPVLEGGNGKEVLLPQRFMHYAYAFRQDVEFKQEYYSGHEGILTKWDKLQQTDTGFPRPLSDFFTGRMARSCTAIVRR